jgi:hypothetical protein
MSEGLRGRVRYGSRGGGTILPVYLQAAAARRQMTSVPLSDRVNYSRDIRFAKPSRNHCT